MEYDAFSRGLFPVGARTVRALDQARGREFPCEIWYPAAGEGSCPDELRDAAAWPGEHPLVVFSHYSGGHRRSATFLCTHLASHGYVVAALDHSEVVATELARRDGESGAQRGARIEAVIASRVPDVRFLLDRLLDGAAAGLRPGPRPDPARIGLVGHSFGGWTVLAVPDTEPRVRSVVALAPGGGANPRPGILPLSLAFAWPHRLPVLLLAAELDVPIPLEGLSGLFERAPEPKRMFVLRRADHQHFVDDVEAAHEAVRAAPFPPEAAWIPAAMHSASELCPAGQAHDFTRGLTVAHLDASLRDLPAAAALLDGDVAATLAARGVEAFEYESACLRGPSRTVGA